MRKGVAAGTGDPPAIESGLVGLKAIRAAAERLRGVARRTPLIEAGALRVSDPRVRDGGELPDEPPRESGAGPQVWLKCENLQHAGAFKLRGAYNFVALLPPAEREKGVLTFSSGNHAQGVAYAAREFGIPAVIVMPEDAPRVKLEGTRRLGAEVVQAGTTTTERRARAEELLAERGGTMVPPFDHPDIIAGQGTVGIEIAEQLQEPRDRRGAERAALVLVPVGGGGLVSGIAAALRTLAPGTRVVGVEPEGAAKMSRSLEAGHPVTLDEVQTIADGLKPVRPGDLTFLHCQELVERMVTVSDEEMRDAVLWCFRRKLVAEPSGAAVIAALRSGRVPLPAPEEGSVVAVLSGGNIEASQLCGWLEGG